MQLNNRVISDEQHFQRPKINRQYTNIWFKKTDQEVLFHCHRCQCPLFKYQGNVVTEVPGENNGETKKVMKFPMTYRCRGNSITWGKCPMVYVIEGFVE